MIIVIINNFDQTDFFENISAIMNKGESSTIKASPKICWMRVCGASFASSAASRGPAMDRRRGCKT